MIVSRRQHHQNQISVEDMTFEKVSNFKYFGVDVNESANNHEEINRRIIAGNKSYFSMVPLFKLKLLSRNTKIRLYKTLVNLLYYMHVGNGQKTKINYFWLITIFT